MLWDQAGARKFEGGVSHAVLYPPGKPGVPWNGLVSVTEHKSTGEITSHYIDGAKYTFQAAGADFDATLEAYTYPKELDDLQGAVPIGVGISAWGQPLQYFGLSYVTLVGNDIKGFDYNYRIHLVYNVIIVPNDHTYTSHGETASAETFSWNIKTVPEVIPGVAPTPVVVIDPPPGTPLPGTPFPPDVPVPPWYPPIYGDPPPIDGGGGGGGGGGGSGGFPIDIPLPGDLIPLFPPVDPDAGLDPDTHIIILDLGGGLWSAEGPEANIIDWGDGSFDIDDVDATFIDANTYTVTTTTL